MIRKFLFSSIGLSLIAALLIIGGGIYLKKATEKPGNSIQNKINLIAQESIQKAINNGQVDVSEWEEAFKKNAASSTEEKIANLQEKYAKTTQNDQNLTATDRFSQALLQKYVDFKNKGGVLDDNTTLQFVNELIVQDYGGPELEKTYDLSDIIVLDTDLPSELKKYGNAMGIAVSRPVSAGFENEITIINRVYETDDASYLAKLPENLARYRDARAIATKIPVPKNLVNAHLAFLNSLSAMIEGVKGMTLIDTDPIGAAKMMLSYEDGLKSFDPALRIISNYFKTRNIEFSSSESGYVFLK